MAFNVVLDKKTTDNKYSDDLNEYIGKYNDLTEEVSVYGGKTLKSGRVIRPTFLIESTTKYEDELEAIYDEYGLICSLIYEQTEETEETEVSINNDNKKALIEDYFGEFTFNNQKIFFYFLKIVKAMKKGEAVDKRINKELKELETKEED